MEDAVREAIAEALAIPELIIAEYLRLAGVGDNQNDIDDLNHQKESLRTQHGRLVKLYQMGEVEEDYLKSESKAIRAEKDSKGSSQRTKSTHQITAFPMFVQW